jgi:hypothetical protein
MKSLKVQLENLSQKINLIVQEHNRNVSYHVSLKELNFDITPKVKLTENEKLTLLTFDELVPHTCKINSSGQVECTP